MEILLQLGANETAFIQFFLFVITISFLTVVIYNPFFKANDQRLAQTKGADQVAAETQDEAKKLELIFQARAREINDKVRSVFEISKNEATESANKILNESKQVAAAATEKAMANIENQKQSARQNSQAIAEEVSAEISKKLMGASL
jgi:F0F1-type ATP synthase membrane subunit b/b'